MALIKIGQAAAAREFIPGADQLAIVAAVDAIAQQRAQLGRNGAGVLNRQVRDAAPRIQPVWRDDGSRGTSIHAGRAVAAVVAIGFWLRHGQRQIGKDFAQKEHGASLAVEQQGVLAAPALCAAAGQLSFEHGRGIGKHPIAHAPHMLLDPGSQLLQAGTQHLVVIAPTGINRYDCLARLQQALQFALAPIGRGGGGQVVHAGGNHPHCARHQLGRARALQAVRGHVVHIAMKTLRQPGQQPLFCAAQIHISHANAAKAQIRSGLPDGGQ